MHAVEILLYDSTHYKGLTLRANSRQIMWLCFTKHNYCNLQGKTDEKNFMVA